MNEKSIVWRKRLAENQLHQSTWLVEADGVICIAKKIETDNAEKLQSLVNRLKRQVRFSEILNAEEQKSISLFDKMVETPKYVAFLRKYRDGDPLDKYLATRRSSVSEAVELMLKIARAVQIAHEHNVFHGDLKPANIIVGKDGEVSIIDWDTMSISDGVQKELIGPDVTLDQVRGTPQYMPIEQFQGAKITEQSDVYALGVILYQILAGATPFDRDCGTTPTEMAIYKQNHEPENILVKYPALGIPADLGKLIEEALKNDLNQRIPSVSLLISRLELVGKITASPLPTPPEPPRSADFVPAPTKGGEHKLVLIGYTGAGKTCLVGGLYATQDKDFAVEDPGSKTETGNHAINIKTTLEGGRWPAATSVGTITRLRFKINYKGKEEAIAFDEYAGELLGRENSDLAIIKDSDGALILLNPGGAQWHSIRSKNTLLSGMKLYIETLSKMPNHPPIALVVTASDRLQSDLKEFAPQFQNYLTELENALIRRTCIYKIFYVSVSGVLKDQAHPRLEPQGFKDPFLWLLEKFTARKRRSAMRKAAIVAAVVAGILGLAWSGNCVREYLKINSFRKDFLTRQTSFNRKGTKSLDDLIEYRNQLVEVRNSVCQQKHVDMLSRRGECSAACEPWFLPDFFHFQEKFRGVVSTVERELDSVNGEYFRRVLDQALQKPDKDNRKNAAKLTEWKPLQPEAGAKAEELRKKYAGEMPLAVERFDANELEKKFRELIEPKSESKEIAWYPDDVDAEYREWLGRKSVLPPEERRKVEERLRNLEKSARETVFQRGCTLLQSRIAGFSGSSVDDLQNLVNENKQFQEHPVPGVDVDSVSRQKAELETALERRVANFITRASAEALKTQMANDAYEVPDWVRPMKERVVVLLPPEIRKRFEEQINTNELERKFRLLIGSKKIVLFPDDVDAEYREWLERGSVLPPEERREAEERVRNLEKSARETVFQRGCTLLQNRITGFNGNSVDDLVNLVNESKQFLEHPVPGVDSGLVSRQKAELETALEGGVDKFIKRVSAEAQKKLMASEVYEVPGWVQPVKERVAVLFPPEIRRGIEEQSDQLAAAGKREWEQAQQKKVDEFVTQIQYRSGADALDALKGFYLENRLNPYISRAEDRVAEMALKEFNENFPFAYTEQAFRHLKEFCAKVQATPSKKIQGSELYKFARRYFAWMQSNPKYTIQIHRVDARSTYEDGAYIYRSSYRIREFGKETTPSLKPVLEDDTNIFKGDWKTICNGFNVVCNPWEFLAWRFSPYEVITLGGIDELLPDKELDIRALSILPAWRDIITFEKKEVEKSNGYVEVSFDQITLRIYYTVSGTTLPEMIQEAFGK